MTPQLAFLLNQALQYLRADNLDSAELLLKQALSVLKTNSEVLRIGYSVGESVSVLH